jgi:succinoglycan biosynthesis transport protein ExoP
MNSNKLTARRDAFLQERALTSLSSRQPVKYEVDFAEAWRILKKRKHVTFIVVGLALGTAIALSLLMPKRYEAVARLDVDLTTMMPTLEDTSSQTVQGTSEDPSTRLTSQVEILRTDAIAWDTIRQLRLDQKASFTAGILSRFTGNTDVSAPGVNIDHVNPLRRRELLDRFQRRLTVILVPKTEILEIRFRDRDPILAAQIVNTMADDYINMSLRHRYTTTMQASSWLTTQLDDLKANVEQSESAFAQYQKEKGIILTHGDGMSDSNTGSFQSSSSNIVLDKLEQTNHALTAAEADRFVKEARLRTAQSHDPELITSMESSTNGPGATLGALRTREAGLKADLARETSYYRDNYPTVVQLRNELAGVESSIANQMKRITQSYQTDYDQALENERILTRSLDAQKQEAYRLNQDAIRLEVLRRDAAASRETYDDVLKKLKIAGVLAGLKATNLTVVDPAAVPAIPSEPRTLLMLSISLFGGLLVGLGGSFAAESLDSTIRTPDDVENLCGMPSLGIVPILAPPLRPHGKAALPEMIGRPQSQAAEAYRCMRSALLLADPEAPPKILVVTSGVPKEGKTTTSVNIALVMAQKGSRVLLVDADLRRPSVHQKLGVRMNGGLSAMLAGGSTFNPIKIDGVPRLDILPAGARPVNPAELLDSSRMRELIRLSRQHYDHVIIDCPPLLGLADSVILATMADAVVVIARSGTTRYQTLRRTRDLLASINARLAGVLVNGVDTNSESHYAYYGYYGKNYNSYYLGSKPGAIA